MVRKGLRCAVALGVLLVAASLAHAPAAADPSPSAESATEGTSVSDPGDAAAAAEQAVEDAPASAVQYLTDRLADQPDEGAVVVGEELRGDYDVDLLTSELHELFDQVGQPYNVVVTESLGWDTDLAVIAEEVNRDGLYVLLFSNGSAEVLERGMSLDAEAAARAVNQQRDSGDHSVLASAEVFTGTLTGERESTSDRDSAYRPPILGWDLSYDRHAAQFGTAVGVVAGLTLLGVVLGQRRFRRPVLFITLTVVPVGLVLAGTSLVYRADNERVESEQAAAEANANDPTYRADEPGYSEDPPYVPDTTRLEAASAALAESRVYVDPGAAGALDAEAASALAERAVDTDAFVAVAHLNSTDESDGDSELFLHALHAVHGEAGAYVLVEPDDYRAQVEVQTFDIQSDAADMVLDLLSIETTDPASAAQSALDTIEQAPQNPSDPDPPMLPDAETPRVGDSSLAAFAAPGLILGFGIAVGVAVALVFVSRVRQGGTPTGQTPLGGTAPNNPTTNTLERMFDEELERLRSAIEGTEREKERGRAVEVLDAVLLLAGEDPDPDDLVGMVVLCRRGVLLAGGDAQASAPVCRHNPLHGAAVNARRRRGGSYYPAACKSCRDGDPGMLTLAEPRTSAQFWSEHDYGVDPAATARAIRRSLGVS